jgi:hypothetical protein
MEVAPPLPLAPVQKKKKVYRVFYVPGRMKRIRQQKYLELCENAGQID